MPDFNAWLGLRGRRGISTEARAVQAWQRIQDKASTVTLYRGAVAQTAQTMRLEWQRAQPGRVMGAAQTAIVTRLVLFGVRDHPDDAVTDTDVQHGDRFTLDGVNFQVIDVATYPGEVQAWAERIQ